MRTRGPLAAFAAFGVFWGSWGALLPDIKAATGASETELGLALLAIAGGALPAMLGTGLLLDRFGPRALAPILALFAGTAVLPAFANSVTALALVLVPLGAASGAVDVAMSTAVSSLEASTGRRRMQTAHALFSAGVVPASLAVGLARNAGVGRLAILLAAAGALLAVAALNARERPFPAPAARARPRLRLSGPVLVLGALCAAGFLFESGVQNWSALYLETEGKSSPAVGGAAPAAFALAMVAGRVLGQGLGPRLGDRLLLVGGAVLGGLGLMLAAAVPAPATALAGFALAGAGIAVVAPTIFGVVGRRASASERGGAVASVTTVAYFGFLAGPPFMGAVSGGLGLRVGFLALAGVGILIALASARVRALALA